LSVQAPPEGYHSVTPYLHVSNVGRLIDFLKQSFDAVEMERFLLPDGRIEHAEVKIGDSTVMMSEASQKYPSMPTWVYLYVGNIDESHKKAVHAGGTPLMSPTDVYYGERVSGIKDPSGNIWWISTRKENITTEEIRKRLEARADKRNR